MAKVPVVAPALHRVPDTCATLDELREQTRLLYLSITAAARRTNAEAKRLTRAKRRTRAKAAARRRQMSPTPEETSLSLYG